MYMRESQETPRQHQQTGFVSIIVTMIIMVLLSLIVLGFAKVSRRESRQGLDRQLASQARYAAETGINDAQSYLKNNGTLSATASSSCNTYAAGTGPAGTGGLPSAVMADIADNVSYSCVLVDSTVEELVYNGVDTSQQVIVPVKANSSISQINIAWQGPSGGTNYALCPPPLSASGSWGSCPVGALRVDIIPGDSISMAGGNGWGTLLYPVGSGGSTSVSVGSVQGKQVRTNCGSGTPPRNCSMTFSGFSTLSSYYLRIRPVYQSANIYVSATDGGPHNLILKGAQATIDSTGRAGDVLKRLVAYVPICQKSERCGIQPAGFAIQSADTICKRYAVIPPGGVSSDAGYASEDNCKLP